MNVRVFVGMIVIALVGTGLFAAPVSAGEYVGKKFPEFSATDPVSKKKFSLDDYMGKVVLIDFWATWCGPCIKELPTVRQAYDKFKDDGLVIISVSLDKDAAKFHSFVKSNSMPWVHVMEGGGWSTRLAKKYGINSIPKMFLLDHKGVCISDSARGSALSPAIEGAITKLKQDMPVAEKSAAAEPKPAEAPKEESMMATWHADLTAAAEQVQSAFVPLNDLAAQCAEAREENEVAKAAAIRREAFMMGLLNDSPVVIPAENLTAVKRAELTGVAIQRVIENVSAAQARFESVFKDLSTLAKAIQDQTITGDRARVVVTKSLTDARQLLSQWSPAWKSQLASLDITIDGVCQRKGNIARQIDAAERALGDIRFSHSTKPDPDKVRRQLNSLRYQLAAIRVQLQNLGEGDAVLPGDASGAAIDATIKTAGEAIVQLRQHASKQDKAFQAVRDSFAPKIKALQAELAAVQPQDTSALENVRQKFATLSDELLAAWDKI